MSETPPVDQATRSALNPGVCQHRTVRHHTLPSRMDMSNPIRVAAVLALVTVVASPARSQNVPNEDRPSWFERRMSGSIGGWVMQPTGELAKNLNTGIGL